MISKTNHRLILSYEHFHVFKVQIFLAKLFLVVSQLQKNSFGSEANSQ